MQRYVRGGTGPGRLGLMALGVLLCFFMIGTSSAFAETGKKALILESSVSGGSSSPEATEAANSGFEVTLVDDATWGAMTTAQFSDYQLIVVGDPTCRNLPQVVSENAAALAGAVMGGGSNTQAGNRVLIGTDPVFHLSQGGNRLVDTAIDFAGVQEGASGLYLSFTCGDPDYDGDGTRDGEQKLLPLLTIDPTPGWSQNASPPCGGSVSLISNTAQFSALRTSDLQGWNCSVHESFPTFPTDWNPLAIATDTPTRPTCGNDVDTGEARCGEAYLLIAGSGITAEAPNLDLTPKTATVPVGTQHTVTAKVIRDDGTPQSGVAVDFVVTGANAGASGTCNPADCTSDSNGEVTFTYTGTSLGEDTVNASITLNGSRQSETAAVTWVAAAAAAPPTPTQPTAAPSCVRRAISLVRADVRGRNVVLRGLVAPRFAGERVAILANYKPATRSAFRRVATVRANSAGEFTARVRRPSRRQFNKARFRARISRFRSPSLKLPQVLRTTSVRQVSGQIEVRGRVKRSLVGRRNPVVVKRLFCGGYRTVGQARPDRRGNYVVRFAAPGNVPVALFRAESRVLNRAGGRRYVKQYARAVSIRLTNQSG